ITASLDASSLTAGYHRVSVRSLTDNAESSVPYTRQFIRKGGDLVKWQYWFNDAIATAVDISLTPPTDLLELITSIDASGLPAGPNTVTWRSADAVEVWSPPITYAFDAFVGITEFPGLTQLTLFPNPAKEDLFLRLDQTEYMDVMIDLLDQEGRIIWSKSSAHGPGSNVEPVDASMLSSGAYQLRISNGDASVTRPFIKY
ncbi:MAG: T9SS type A sorting domain-containing protein, partial [Flavobacteriales bacterium]|nr:T9SS type A sorting domain-containing protein [Flavobacteriales bacterium]